MSVNIHLPIRIEQRLPNVEAMYPAQRPGAYYVYMGHGEGHLINIMPTLESACEWVTASEANGHLYELTKVLSGQSNI